MRFVTAMFASIALSVAASGQSTFQNVAPSLETNASSRPLASGDANRVPTRDEMLGALSKTLKDCKEDITKQSQGISDLRRQLASLDQQMNKKLDVNALFDQLLREAVAAQSKDRVCMSRLIRDLSDRVQLLDAAIGSQNESNAVVIPSPAPVIPASTSTAISSGPNYTFPVDGVTDARGAICRDAKLIQRCKDVSLAGNLYHGDLYLDCTGKRYLLTHTKIQTSVQPAFSR